MGTQLLRGFADDDDRRAVGADAGAGAAEADGFETVLAQVGTDRFERASGDEARVRGALPELPDAHALARPRDRAGGEAVEGLEKALKRLSRVGAKQEVQVTAHVGVLVDPHALGR